MGWCQAVDEARETAQEYQLNLKRSLRCTFTIPFVIKAATRVCFDGFGSARGDAP